MRILLLLLLAPTLIGRIPCPVYENQYKAEAESSSWSNAVSGVDGTMDSSAPLDTMLQYVYEREKGLVCVYNPTGRWLRSYMGHMIPPKYSVDYTEASAVENFGLEGKPSTSP